MKIAIVITGLSTGGAEAMLLKLLERIDRSRFSFHVFSLTSLGSVGGPIQSLGFPVDALGMKRGAFRPFAVFDLGLRLRDMQPDVVHTWMYHADLLGGLAACYAGAHTIAWGIRNTNLDYDKTKLSTRLVVRLNALLSRWVPTGILSCSESARDAHIARGYAAAKMTVIPNGFDLSQFRPDADARAAVRVELGLPVDTPLVGMVGRYDPLKNHAGFLQAAGLLRRSRPDTHFVLVGKGVEKFDEALAAAARRAGLGESVHWLGHRTDMPRLMASFDVLALSSFGEAFPNVIGEAMACGVPCAVTDVGDSAAIVGDAGRVVKSDDMPALAAAIGDLLALPTMDRLAIGRLSRARIEEHFELDHVVRRYEDYYTRLARKRT